MKAYGLGTAFSSTTPYRYMGVQRSICYAGYHVLGVCAHPGSKADLAKAKERRRARNKQARISRRVNR